jgi:hypothetical protein
LGKRLPPAEEDENNGCGVPKKRVEEKVIATSKSDWNPNSTRLKLAKNKT